MAGLYRKYDVRRTDGRDAPGFKHHGCRYFVLDLDHDEHARAAIRAYRSSIMNDPELYGLLGDLNHWLETGEVRMAAAEK